MWSHDEQKNISDGYVAMARVRCPYCKCIVRKYVESHYTGGTPCVLFAKYCRNCGHSLSKSIKI